MHIGTIVAVIFVGMAIVAGIFVFINQPPEPTERPQEFLPGVNADGFKAALVDGLNATCRDGDGADDRMWTCSYQDAVAISFYGPRPAEVSAFRVVTDARREVDRRSWLRGYASHQRGGPRVGLQPLWLQRDRICRRRVGADDTRCYV